MRNPQFVFEQFRAVLEPRKPRHPLLRLAFGLAGLVILAGLLVVGLFVGTAMLLAGLAMRLVGGARRPAAATARATPPGVIDAQYTVVPRQTLDTPR